MSYDLFVRSREGELAAPLDEVSAALRDVGARQFGESQTRYRIGAADIDLALRGESSVWQLEITSPHEIESPDRVYIAVSAVASQFGWQILDPQAGEWNDTREVASGDSRWRLEPKVACWLVMIVGIGTGAVASMLARRNGPGNLLLSLMIGGLLVFAAGRIALFRIERSRRAV